MKERLIKIPFALVSMPVVLGLFIVIEVAAYMVEALIWLIDRSNQNLDAQQTAVVENARKRTDYLNGTAKNLADRWLELFQ